MVRVIPSRKLLLFGYFVAIILSGSLLLSLPEAWGGSGGVRYVDALFTSTSAACVTGLITVNTAEFTRFGQLVILFLIEAGGLGIITFSTLFLGRASRRMSFSSRRLIKDYYLESVAAEPRRIIRGILILTGGAQLAGGVFLFFAFKSAGVRHAGYYALFHSVSAFCNAGFSTFANSLEGFATRTSVTLPILALIITGGLGFVVIEDLIQVWRGKRPHLSLHSRVVLLMSGVLIVTGTAAFYFLERNHGFASLSGWQKLHAALFQSVTPRTAGFDTIAPDSLSLPGKFVTMLLMFIGGGPGSTAGGVKVTTFSLVLFAAIYGTDEAGEIRLGRRRIKAKSVTLAHIFALKALLILIVAVFLLTFAEGVPRSASKEFLSIVFESVSAFGTVGLSTGLTPYLTTAGKLVIIATMFAGRIGLISMAMPRSHKPEERLVDYPTGEILIG